LGALFWEEKLNFGEKDFLQFDWRRRRNWKERLSVSRWTIHLFDKTIVIQRTTEYRKFYLEELDEKYFGESKKRRNFSFFSSNECSFQVSRKNFKTLTIHCLSK